MFPSSESIELKLRDKNRMVTDAKGDGNLNVDKAREVEKLLLAYQQTPSNYEAFDVKANLGQCGTFPYGYIDTEAKPIKPCVFLRLNRIFGWVPESKDGVAVTCTAT